MQEYPFSIRKDGLFNSKTTCFTLKSDYDREPFSVISHKQLAHNELIDIITENRFFAIN